MRRAFDRRSFRKGDKCLIISGEYAEAYYGYIFTASCDEYNYRKVKKDFVKLHLMPGRIETKHLTHVLVTGNEPDFNMMSFKEGDVIIFDLPISHNITRVQGRVVKPLSNVAVRVEVINDALKPPLVVVYKGQIKYHINYEESPVSRRKGSKMQPNTVKVDRSTKWGNPYKIKRIDGFHLVLWKDDETQVFFATDDMRLAIERSVELYEGYFDQMIKSKSLNPKELCGKNIGCWCPHEYPDGSHRPCHGDYILEKVQELCKDK